MPVLVSELSPALILSFAFVLGALWGSFFNVAIHRWPRDMSVVSPPSHCPACNAPIPAWRNLPIFAYFLQRGRAACCGAKMTPRYAVVELLSALLAVALAQRFIVETGPGAEMAPAAIDAALWFVLVGALVIATFVDLEWMEIPDEASIGGAAVGLATVSMRTGITPADAALGAGAGFLVVQVFLVWGWERFSGRRGMGEGDSKLLMMIGAFLGWRGALFALVGGSMQGVVAYVFGRAMGVGGPGKEQAPSEKPEKATEAPEAAETTEDAEADDASGDEEAEDDEPEEDVSQRIPFGPFLALGALEFLFFGEPLVRWYLSLFE